jgi:L-asparaginase
MPQHRLLAVDGLDSPASDTIMIYTTGGTIDKSYFDALSEYQISDTMIPKLLDTAKVTRGYHIEPLFCKDSLDLSDADRQLIRRHVAQCDALYVIITHGTDRMTKTAKALDGITDKVIVLVGALAPARFAESDAAFNLGLAFATVQCAAPGIYITMNGTVFDALRVEKDHALGQFVALSG